VVAARACRARRRGRGRRPPVLWCRSTWRRSSVRSRRPPRRGCSRGGAFCGVGAEIAAQITSPPSTTSTAAMRVAPLPSRPYSPALEKAGCPARTISAPRRPRSSRLTVPSPCTCRRAHDHEEGTLTRWLSRTRHDHSGSAHLRDGTEKSTWRLRRVRGILKRSLPRGRSHPAAVVAPSRPGETLPTPSEIKLRLSPKRRNGAGSLMRLIVLRPGNRKPLARYAGRSPPATEKRIDLTAIRGSVRTGRIHERDVMNAVERRRQPESPRRPRPGRRATGGRNELHAYSGRRRTIGERMQQSLAVMPRLTLVRRHPSMECSDDSRPHRSGGRRRSGQPHGAGRRACALALRDHRAERPARGWPHPSAGGANCRPRRRPERRRNHAR